MYSSQKYVVLKRGLVRANELYYEGGTALVYFFKEIYCTESVYGVYKDELQIFPVTSFNKYLQCGTSGIEYYVCLVYSVCFAVFV